MFWKIYFWLLTISYIVILISGIFTGSLELTGVIDYLLSIIGLLAVYGYSYKKRFFNPLVWKLYFPVIIIWDLLYAIIARSQVPVGPNLIIIVISYSLIILVLLPLYIALFKYAYWDQGQIQVTIRSTRTYT